MTERKPTPALSPERLIELSRGLVLGHMLVAEDTAAWRTALLLIAPALAQYDDLGAVIVPVKPHTGGRWINGVVPAVVIECTPINKADAETLRATTGRMQAAMFPDAPT